LIILSKLADYGVILGVHLARESGRAPAEAAPTTAGSLAEATQLPTSTVAKVLKSLARAGLVTSVRGAAGGYRLGRPAALITIADMVKAIDGPLGVTQCTSDEDHCSRQSFCLTRPHWSRINSAVAAALSSVSLADMASPFLAESRPVALPPGLADQPPAPPVS
jgi:FeS assembly SUF system regulator